MPTYHNFKYFDDSSSGTSMSYPDKQADTITRDEWVSRLEGVHVQRSDMNNLIMNYLVTGQQLTK